MRTHIWKALRARSKAIQNALQKYNTLAKEMSPPAPTLEWKTIVDYGFVAEFDLLKHQHSHFNIATVLWALPANREVANKFHKIRRAREEIVRLNVEIRRLRTSIDDEELWYKARIGERTSTDPHLAAQLQADLGSRRRVNQRHLQRIFDIEQLPGYTGSYSRGTREGAEPSPSNLSSTSFMPLQESSTEVEFDSLDDEMNENMAALEDFLERAQ